MKFHSLKTLINQNRIYEAIATTFNENKKPHSAPAGFYTKNFRTIIVELYKTSGTYKNIIREREFAINFTDEIQIFYKSAISKKGLEYAKAGKIDAPILKDADGHIGLKVTGVKDLGDKVEIESEIINFKLNKKVNLINRAKSLAIESIINLTKIPYVSDSDKKFLKKETRKYRKIIKKVAPDTEYEIIAEKLTHEKN